MKRQLYRKLLAAPGYYDTEQGPTYITNERIERWIREHQKMQRIGLAVPIPFAHKLSAIPTLEGVAEDDDDTRNAVREAMEEAYSTGNTGYIERLEKGKNGALYMVAEAPPGYVVNKRNQCLENPTTGNRIREVSPGIGTWVDGFGNQHKDVILHAAICTHPVQPGQPGFEPLPESAKSALPTGLQLLSSAGAIRFEYTLSARKNMAQGKPPKPGADDEDDDITNLDDEGGEGVEPNPDEFAGDGDGDENAAMLDAPAPAPEALPPDPTAATPSLGVSPQDVELFKQLMQSLGAPLLPDTNGGNLVERLKVALHNAVNSGGSLVAKPGGADGGAGDLNTDVSNGVPDQNTGMGGYGGIFMSALTGKRVQLDASGLKLAQNAAGVEKARLKKEWSKLASCGSHAFKQFCAEEVAKLDRYHMSLNPNTGKVTLEAARRRLADVKKIASSVGTGEFKALLSRATVPQPNPAATVPPSQASGTSAPSEAISAEVHRLVERTTGAKVSV